MKKRTLIPALVAAVFATGCTFTADPNRDYNPYSKRQSYALNTVTALGLNEGMKDYSEKHLKQGLPGPSFFSTITDFAYIFSPAGAGVLNSAIATVAHPTNGYAGYRSAIMGWEPRVDDTRSVEEALVDYFTKAEKASLDTLTEMGFGEFYTPDEKPYQLKLSTMMSGNLYSTTRVWHFTHPDQNYQCTKRNECMLIIRVAAHNYSDESAQSIRYTQMPRWFKGDLRDHNNVWEFGTSYQAAGSHPELTLFRSTSGNGGDKYTFDSLPFYKGVSEKIGKNSIVFVSGGKSLAGPRVATGKDTWLFEPLVYQAGEKYRFLNP